jgi:hypothetical protein
MGLYKACLIARTISSQALGEMKFDYLGSLGGVASAGFKAHTDLPLDEMLNR